MVLAARLRLDAGGDIDRVWPDAANRLPNIVWCQSARQYQRQVEAAARLRRNRPVERFATSAQNRLVVGIEEDRVAAGACLGDLVQLARGGDAIAADSPDARAF